MKKYLFNFILIISLLKINHFNFYLIKIKIKSFKSLILNNKIKLI